MTVSFDEMELERAARSAASSTAFTLDTNERLRLGEFRAHGVEPPEIGGVPTRSSFHLLVSLGWTIEEAKGQPLDGGAGATVATKTEVGL